MTSVQYETPTIDPETFNHQQIADLLNRAADEVISRADLPETGTIDALNLLVNLVGMWLRNPDAPAEQVADDYDIDDEDLLTDEDYPEDFDAETDEEPELSEDEKRRRRFAKIIGWIRG